MHPSPLLKQTHFQLSPGHAFQQLLRFPFNGLLVFPADDPTVLGDGAFHHRLLEKAPHQGHGFPARQPREILELAHHQHEQEKVHEPGPPGPSPQGQEKEQRVSEKYVHQEGNPHVWLDPVLAQDICRRIAQAFIQVDPEHKQEYESNLAAYLAKLEDLHEEISKKVATFRQRDYVCFHPAFAYFARRYGIREVGVIEAAPGREPSPGHLQRIITALKTCQSRAVFAEPQLNPKAAEVIARETGVEIALLDPLGGQDLEGRDSYLNLMRYNLSEMKRVLGRAADD